MTEREVRQRIAYLSRYMQNVSPRVSNYKELMAERAAYREYLDALTKLPP